MNATGWKRSSTALDYGTTLLDDTVVRLRETTNEDIELLASWWNDPAYALLQKMVAKPRPEASNREMFEAWSVNAPHSGSCGFSIVSAEDGELYGHVTVYGATLPARAGELGIMIAPKYTGQGLGARALELILGYAFRELGLNRLGLKVWAYNTWAIKAYERAGFKKEGVRRQAVFHGGRFHDEVLMSVLAEEFWARAEG